MKWLLGAVLGVLTAGLVALLGVGARDGRGRVTAAVEIDRPPSAVFPFLVQPELRKLWSLGLVEAKLSGSSTDLRAGAKSRVVIEAAERLEVDEEIRVLDADRRLLLQRTSSHPPFSQRLEYILKEVGGRTLLTSAVHTTHDGLLLNLFEPLVTRAAQGRLEQELLALRTSAEAPPPAQPASAALKVVSSPAPSEPETAPPAPEPAPPVDQPSADAPPPPEPAPESEPAAGIEQPPPAAPTTPASTAASTPEASEPPPPGPPPAPAAEVPEKPDEAPPPATATEGPP
jgi:uncharacterized protein YndB with AHSA1/START domain